MHAAHHPLRERLGLPAEALPWAPLGQWPTPVTPLTLDDTTVWLKREDLAHPRYGGNKVRTLEMLLGDAAARGVTRVWAMGAYGSNHAVATLVHAPRAGLRAGALLFPQPASAPAMENLRAALSLGGPIQPVASVALLPLAMAATWRRERRAGERPWLMPPGGATPLGALGALSAAFELAEQVAEHHAPPPAAIVVAAGSSCTAAGLLAGLALARRLGAWRWPMPRLHAVRVTPWPVTSSYRISALAERTLQLVEVLRSARHGRAASLGITRAQLREALAVDGSQLGGGYGRASAAGTDAATAFAHAGGPPLDCVYTAKSGAALRVLIKRNPGPLLYWSTKSFAPAPVGPALQRAAPMMRWLAAHAPADADTRPAD